MRIYIAGPMRGYESFNFPAFYAAEERLVAEGHEVFNPARRDNDTHGDLQSSTGDLNDIPEFSLREAMKVDTSWICEHADAVYLLQGWQLSAGAKAERMLADALGLRIMQEVHNDLH